ncbi:MAG: DsrE family protein [Promethearchaeota archaeon]
MINRSPYGDEYAFNAIQLATALLLERVKLNIFLLGEDDYIAVKNQKPSKSATNIEEILKKFIINRAENRVCGLCAINSGYRE